MKNEHFEIIESYILDKIHQKDKFLVEKKIANDPEFRQEYEHVSDMILGIQSYALKSSLRNKKIEDLQEAPVHKLGNTNRSITIPLSIAASIAVLIIASLWYFQGDHSRDQLYAEAFYPDPGLPTKMSAASKQYNFYDAMVDYKTEEYEVALEKWQNLTQPIGIDTLHYYQAMALINLQKYNSAAQFLSEIPQESQLHTKAQWRKLEILIKKENWEEAKDFFNTLPPDIHLTYEKVKVFLSKK